MVRVPRLVTFERGEQMIAQSNQLSRLKTLDASHRVRVTFMDSSPVVFSRQFPALLKSWLVDLPCTRLQRLQVTCSSSLPLVSCQRNHLRLLLFLQRLHLHFNSISSTWESYSVLSSYILRTTRTILVRIPNLPQFWSQICPWVLAWVLGDHSWPFYIGWSRNRNGFSTTFPLLIFQIFLLDAFDCELKIWRMLL